MLDVVRAYGSGSDVYIGGNGLDGTGSGGGGNGNGLHKSGNGGSGIIIIKTYE